MHSQVQIVTDTWLWYCQISYGVVKKISLAQSWTSFLNISLFLLGTLCGYFAICAFSRMDGNDYVDVLIKQMAAFSFLSFLAFNC